MENIEVAPFTVTVAPAVAVVPVTSMVPELCVNVPLTVNEYGVDPDVITNVPVPLWLKLPSNVVFPANVAEPEPL